MIRPRMPTGKRTLIFALAAVLQERVAGLYLVDSEETLKARREELMALAKSWGLPYQVSEITKNAILFPATAATLRFAAVTTLDSLTLSLTPKLVAVDPPLARRYREDERWQTAMRNWTQAGCLLEDDQCDYCFDSIGEP